MISGAGFSNVDVLCTTVKLTFLRLHFTSALQIHSQVLLVEASFLPVTIHRLFLTLTILFHVLCYCLLMVCFVLLFSTYCGGRANYSLLFVFFIILI